MSSPQTSFPPRGLQTGLARPLPRFTPRQSSVDRHRLLSRRKARAGATPVPEGWALSVPFKDRRDDSTKDARDRPGPKTRGQEPGGPPRGPDCLQGACAHP